MGRRNLHSPEELKELILQAAYDIIKDGRNNITARNIAAKIGYTAGTLYHVFESLDDIVLHLKSRALDKFEICFSEYFAENPFTIKNFFGFYINYCLNSRQDWLLMVERILEKEGVPAWYQEKFAHLFNILIATVSQATNSDYQQASTLTKLMWASAQGLCMLSLKGQLEIVNDHDLHTLQKEFSNLFELFVNEHALA